VYLMAHLLIISLACVPLVVPTWMSLGRARRCSTPQLVSAGRHRRLTRGQATAAEAAVARVVTRFPGYQGNTLQLPCRGCGTRAVPPVEYRTSPPIPFERASVQPLLPGRFVIVAMCTACDSPLVSRVLDDEYVAMALSMGAIDGEAAEAELAADLAHL
jgi:hypothetical protein